MHQQHIQQAIMKMEIRTGLTTLFACNCATFTCVSEFVCFILLFLIYFSLLFIRVGVGTCFPTLPLPEGLLVGCQWVCEPILSPLLNKLITDIKRVTNSATNLSYYFLYFLINFKVFQKWLILKAFQS